jgi:predicted DNA-binding transcriptional regulator YafY
MRVPYADATELAMDVLRHGEQVRVIGPAGLAETVSRQLRSAADRYA